MKEKTIVYDVNDVSKKLSVAPFTIRRWLRNGKLRGFKIGGALTDWKILSTDLKIFLNEEYEDNRKKK